LFRKVPGKKTSNVKDKEMLGRFDTSDSAFARLRKPLASQDRASKEEEEQGKVWHCWRDCM